MSEGANRETKHGTVCNLGDFAAKDTLNKFAAMWHS